MVPTKKQAQPVKKHPPKASLPRIISSFINANKGKKLLTFLRC